MISVNERAYENRKDIKRSIEADIAYNREPMPFDIIRKYNQNFIFKCSNRVLEVSPNDEYTVYEYGSKGPTIILTGDLMLAITVADCYNQTSSQTSNVFTEQY